MKRKYLNICASFLTVVASLAASTNCWGLIYQPKTPNKLK